MHVLGGLCFITQKTKSTFHNNFFEKVKYKSCPFKFQLSFNILRQNVELSMLCVGYFIITFKSENNSSGILSHSKYFLNNQSGLDPNIWWRNVRKYCMLRRHHRLSGSRVVKST